MMKHIDVCQSLAPAKTPRQEKSRVHEHSHRESYRRHLHRAGCRCLLRAIPREAILNAEEAELLALRFKALSDPNRLRILSIVSSSEAAETCVCDLPEPLGLKQPTVSHHLKILVDAGILHREKRGVWAYFSVVPGALESLGASLAPKP